jgi:predicted RND superfamily exporter protein
MVKSWSFQKSDPNLTPDAQLERRMAATLSHSATSMLVTSLTTAIAFFASYISSITAIKCFRWAIK